MMYLVDLISISAVIIYWTRMSFVLHPPSLSPPPVSLFWARVSAANLHTQH